MPPQIVEMFGRIMRQDLDKAGLVDVEVIGEADAIALVIGVDPEPFLAAEEERVRKADEVRREADKVANAERDAWLATPWEFPAVEPPAAPREPDRGGRVGLLPIATRDTPEG